MRKVIEIKILKLKQKDKNPLKKSLIVNSSELIQLKKINVFNEIGRIQVFTSESKEKSLIKKYPTDY